MTAGRRTWPGHQPTVPRGTIGEVEVAGGAFNDSVEQDRRQSNNRAEGCR